MVIALLVVLIVLVLAGIAVGLPLLDRLCLARAERRAADVLAGPLGRAVTVRIDGTPFLTQVVRGRYDSVRVSGGGLQIGEMTGATLDARLRGVHLSLRDLLRRAHDGVPCEHVEGEIVLPYGELARVTRIPGLELRFDAGKLTAAAAVPVPGINQLARVSGEAVLRLGDGTGGSTGTSGSSGTGNAVWLRVRAVSVAGINLPGAVLNQLLPALTVPIPLPPLPYGLHLDELHPGPAGLVATGSARDVVFRRPEPAAGSAWAGHRPTSRDERPEL